MTENDPHCDKTFKGTQRGTELSHTACISACVSESLARVLNDFESDLVNLGSTAETPFSAMISTVYEVRGARLVRVTLVVCRLVLAGV